MTLHKSCSANMESKTTIPPRASTMPARPPIPPYQYNSLSLIVRVPPPVTDYHLVEVGEKIPGVLYSRIEK